MRVATAVAGAATLLSACARQQPQDRDEGRPPTRSVGDVIVRPPVMPETPATTHDTNTDEQARLTRLEREARALAKTEGCASVGACRTAPVGWRGCGGPRSYVVYCAATTDTVALFRKLRELEDAEKAYNAKSGMASTCEFRMPPKVRLQGRSCREAPAAQ